MRKKKKKQERQIRAETFSRVTLHSPSRVFGEIKIKGKAEGGGRVRKGRKRESQRVKGCQKQTFL